jgi:hypothetical protein
MIHRKGQDRRQSILVPSKPFRDAGFSRDAKGRALRRLERAGIVQITERRSRRNPRGVLIWRGLP